VLNVGLIGLGTMGGGMAGVLLKAGFPLAVYNRNSERAKPFEAQGARRAASPRDAAQGCDVVIAMVADDQASRQVWTGNEGALAGAKPGTVLIECSTISPGWARELAGLASKQDCHFLDAPVTGSKAQAGSGALRFLVGGEADFIQRADPVLRALGTDVIPLGPVGSGALMKLINNMVCGVQVASIAEAMALIETSGLNKQKALNVLTGGAPGSPLVKTVAGRMTSRDYNVQFAIHLMGKDLSYAIAEGNEHGVILNTVAAALQVFQRAGEAGLGDKDIAAVVEPLLPGSSRRPE
jgi:3-hydroxyisobutyrate dehydrogenase